MVFLASLFCLFFETSAFANGPSATAQVPLNTKLSPPAKDVFIHGKPIDDADQAVEFKRNGIDLSKVDPRETDLWKNKKHSATEYPSLDFPKDGGTVNWIESVDGAASLVLAFVEANNTKFRLTVNLDVHAALMRAALLRKLGWPIPSPKRYKKLTVHFESPEERDTFMGLVVTKTGTKEEDWYFDKSNPPSETSLDVALKDITLEPEVAMITPYHWANLPYKSEQNPNPTDGLRTKRAVLVPLALLNIPESINLYKCESVTRSNRYLVFMTPAGGTFNDVDYFDAQWITRRIIGNGIGLTEQDWNEIVDAGEYPPEVRDHILNITLCRAEHLAKQMGIESNKIDYTKRSMLPKITQEYFDGYVPRFSYGDPKSPLRLGEISRLLGIQVISAGIGAALGQANNYATFFKPDYWVKKYQDKSQAEFLEAITKNPETRYVQPVKVFGGPTFGFNLSASSSLITGSYFGSSSQVQLVEQMGGSANLGVFMGVGGIPLAGISGGPNVSFNLNYVLVRPMADVKTAWKKQITGLAVPIKMSLLARILSTKDDDPDLDKNITKFLEDLAPGELFIINDSLSEGFNMKGTVPLGALVGAPWASNFSVSAEAGLKHTFLARTTFLRTEEGLQIYIQRANSGGLDGGVDFNFFVRLVKAGGAVQGGSAHTRAYIFKTTPTEHKEKLALSRSLRQLFRKNRTSLLESYFDEIKLEHKLNSNIGRAYLGPWQWSRREEFHKVTITPQIDKENTYNPEDKKITLVEGRITRVRGVDPYGFFGNIISGFAPYIQIGGGQRSDDPSGNFLGQSFVQTVHTEADATPGTADRLTTTIEESYNGWIMGRKRLGRIIDRIMEKVRGLVPDDTLISKEDLAITRKLQAYTISSKLWVYENGIDRILRILDGDRTSLLNAYNFLVGLEDRNELENWCKENGLSLDAHKLSGPLPFEQQTSGIYFGLDRGSPYVLQCLKPWMVDALDLRNKVTGNKDLNSKNKENMKGKIVTLNRLFTKIQKQIPLAVMGKWIGEDNFFFLVRISGFRKGDEDTEHEYLSNTIGSVDVGLNGPFSEISEVTGIMSHELSSRYLSDGF